MYGCVRRCAVAACELFVCIFAEVFVGLVRVIVSDGEIIEIGKGGYVTLGCSVL